MQTGATTAHDLQARVARRLSEYQVKAGKAAAGDLLIEMKPGVARTFRAHWTGYRLFYPNATLVLDVSLKDGSFYSEAYISTSQPSFVLCFRKDPHSVRGTGAERPDDKFAAPQSIEVAHRFRGQLIEAGLVRDEEIIRYEDFDDPIEAIDAFFNYTVFYCFKSAGVEWSQIGYEIDPRLAWSDQLGPALVPIAEAIDEGLKKSDIIWLTPDTSDGRSTPCWFVYTKDKRLFVLSGEKQRLPRPDRIRNVHVVTRWKGRDAQMSEFDASVRTITGADGREFKEIGELLVSKRQSVQGSAEEYIESWMRDGAVILELTPRS